MSYKLPLLALTFQLIIYSCSIEIPNKNVDMNTGSDLLSQSNLEDISGKAIRFSLSNNDINNTSYDTYDYQILVFRENNQNKISIQQPSLDCNSKSMLCDFNSHNQIFENCYVVTTDMLCLEPNASSSSKTYYNFSKIFSIKIKDSSVILHDKIKDTEILFSIIDTSSL